MGTVYTATEHVTRLYVLSFKYKEHKLDIIEISIVGWLYNIHWNKVFLTYVQAYDLFILTQLHLTL